MKSWHVLAAIGFCLMSAAGAAAGESPAPHTEFYRADYGHRLADVQAAAVWWCDAARKVPSAARGAPVHLAGRAAGGRSTRLRSGPDRHPPSAGVARADRSGIGIGRTGRACYPGGKRGNTASVLPFRRAAHRLDRRPRLVARRPAAAGRTRGCGGRPKSAAVGTDPRATRDARRRLRRQRAVGGGWIRVRCAAAPARLGLRSAGAKPSGDGLWPGHRGTSGAITA